MFWLILLVVLIAATAAWRTEIARWSARRPDPRHSGVGSRLPWRHADE